VGGERQDRRDNRLSGRRFSEQGGLAGILSRSADDLLDGLDQKTRKRALELLFNLVKVDPERRQHTRLRIPCAEAEAIAGGGDAGRDLVNLLAGRRNPAGSERSGPLRLITITEDAPGPGRSARNHCWVTLIHETLIRSKRVDENGKPQPYWPTLWRYIEANKDRARRRERLQIQAREWRDRKGLARLFGLAGWAGLIGFRHLAAPGTNERRYLRWTLASAAVQSLLLASVPALVGESLYWAKRYGLPLEAIGNRWAYKLGIQRPPFPELVAIPAGAFSMGSESGRSNEQPVHRVGIAHPFYLAATEVTFAQYDAYSEATGLAKPSDAGWPERAKRPVIYVDWNDARRYISWLNAMTDREDCRLPSEAEWEYAARAGTTTGYALPATDGSNDIAGKALANCIGCGSQWDRNQTAPVGSFPPNHWKLYDMHGNVEEWVEDCWHDSHKGAPSDGRAWLEEDGGDCSRRVVRGGSWFDLQAYARSAFRFRNYPDFRFDGFGFRVLCASPIFEH
jgi:formylglycine-generating enzyme required for sulfatase activity